MDFLALIVTVCIIFLAIYHELREKIPGFRERYYASRTWRKRSRMCRRWARGCKTTWCKSPAYLAHHRTYRNFASWTPIELIDLVALCRSCHHGLHQVAKGRMTQAKKKNPYIKYDTVLRQTTNDWISGLIRKELIDR